MITDKEECQNIVNNMSGEEAMAMIEKMCFIDRKEREWWTKQAEEFGMPDSVLFSANKGEGYKE